METKDKVKKIYGLLSGIRKTTDLNTLEGAAKLLRKIITNIVNKPNVDKFRNIRKTNKVLAAKLFFHPQMDEVLTSADFVFDSDEQTFTYFSDDTTTLSGLIVILDGIEMEIEAERNNADADQETINKRKAEMDREVEERKREFEAIQSQIKGDRVDKNKDLKDHPVGDSKARERKFGAKVALCKDILPPPSR